MDAEKITFPLTLRQRKSGDFFHPLGAPGRKKISRFLSDQKIPAAERHNYPLLSSDEKPVAVAGMRIDHAFRVTEKTCYVLVLQWLKD